MGTERIASPTGEAAGQLEISRRKRGSGDLFRAYHVLVDGNDIGEIRRGELRRFPIAAGPHEIHLVIDWCESPSVNAEVQPGGNVKLECWPRFSAWQWKTAVANPNEWIALALAPSSAGAEASSTIRPRPAVPSRPRAADPLGDRAAPPTNNPAKLWMYRIACVAGAIAVGMGLVLTRWPLTLAGVTVALISSVAVRVVRRGGNP